MQRSTDVAPVVRLGPLTFAPLDTAGAVSWILAAAAAGRSCIVVTSNIHHLRLAEEHLEFRTIVAGAELNVADGWPLVAASRIVRGPVLPARVAGVDLVAATLDAGVRLRVAVLGGPAGAAQRFAEQLRDRHEVVFVDELPRGVWDEEERRASLARSLAASRPNLTLIGIGAPRQELLAEQLRGAVGGPIICCGATIEFLSGVRRRAPGPVQAVGLEWAFRVLLEPRRLLPRYAHAAYSFIRTLLREFRGAHAAESR